MEFVPPVEKPPRKRPAKKISFVVATNSSVTETSRTPKMKPNAIRRPILSATNAALKAPMTELRGVR
jgi:hypothetical protein